MIDRAALAYRVGSRLAQALPDRALIPVAKILGKGAARVAGERRQIVERTLVRVDGERSARSLAASVDATFASYATYWLQSFRLPAMSKAEVEHGFRQVGFEHIQAAVEDPNSPGPILALPHLGGWEWAAFWLTLVHGYEVTAVVERIESDELFEWFASYRRSLGMEIVPLGPEVTGKVVKAIKENHVVCLLADRDLERNGVEVEFFGERTTLPGGPAMLALRTGAALIPTVCYLEDGRTAVHAIAGPPLDTSRRGRLRDDVQRLTQNLAHAFEVQIRRAPEQWHLMQPNWPSDFEALGSQPSTGKRKSR